MSSHRSLDDELDAGESEHSSSSLSSSSFIGDDEDESNKSDFSDSHGYQDYVLTHPEKFEPSEEEEENSGNASSRESEAEEEEERKFDKEEEAQQLHEIGEKISCININSIKGSTPEEQKIQLLGEDLSRVNIGDSQGTTLIHQTNPLPCFVVNCIYYASSDAETGSDKDGQGSPLASDDGTFSMQDFNSDNYPFEFGNRNEGSAPKVVSDDDNEEVEKTRTGLDVFIKKLSVEAFKDEGDKRLSTVSASILLNRPYSLSQRKNNFLHKYRAPAFREDGIKIDCKTESILWSHGSWVEKNKDKNVVSHKQVRSFYRQLKKRDAKAARKFRKDNEDKTQADIIKIYNTLKDQSTKDKKQFLEEDKRKIPKELNAKSKKFWAEKFLKDNEKVGCVPYAWLREKLKGNQGTINLIKKAREGNSERDVYLSFIDKDTLDFNSIYQSYHELYEENKNNPPAVMSTGYVYQDSPRLSENIRGIIRPLVIGSFLDRDIRAAIAQHFPMGIYYPEPNTCVLIPRGQNQLGEYEKFTNKKVEEVERGGKNSKRKEIKIEKGYFKNESANLLTQVGKRARNWIFTNKKPPLITTIPHRAAVKPQNGEPLSFSSDCRERDRYNLYDFNELKKSAQASFQPLKLVKNLYINKGFKYIDGNGLGGIGKLNSLLVKIYENEPEDDDINKYVDPEDQGIIRVALNAAREKYEEWREQLMNTSVRSPIFIDVDKILALSSSVTDKKKISEKNSKKEVEKSDDSKDSFIPKKSLETQDPVTEHQILSDGFQGRYQEYRVPGDYNDCFFNSLNHLGIHITRKQAVKRLLENAHRPEIRALVAPEIAALAMDPTQAHRFSDLTRNELAVVSGHDRVLNLEINLLREKLFDRNDVPEEERERIKKLRHDQLLDEIDKLKTHFPHHINELNNLDTQIRNLLDYRRNSILPAIANEPEIFRDFVERFIREQDELGFYQMMGVPRSTGAIDAIAEIFGFELAVFEHIEDAEQHNYRTHNYQPHNLPANQPTAFLILNINGNHFNPLRRVTRPYDPTGWSLGDVKTYFLLMLLGTTFSEKYHKFF